MGLFGFNAEKKVAKGQEQLAKGLFYEAKVTFEEILVRDGIEGGIVAQSKDGWRRARKGLIEIQAAEAEQLTKAGDIRGAIDSWRAIVEMAGDDLDAGDAGKMLAEHGGETSFQAKILEGLDDVAPVARLPVEEEDGQEYSSDDPEEIFEVYLQTLPEQQAEEYRTLGVPFRDAYLLIQEGKSEQALDRLSEADEEIKRSPYFLLESAQAHMLIDQNEQALSELDALDPPAVVRRRAAEMRAVLLARLNRGEEAEAAALRVWEEGKDADAAVLYTEILLGHGRFDRALEIVKPFVHPALPQPEVDRLAARAYAGLGRIGEERNLLERAVESFFQGPIGGMRDAPSFPLWAARDLLELYAAEKEAPEKVRSLAQHLIRHDPASAAKYRETLGEYARSLEEGNDGGGEEGVDADGGEATERISNGGGSGAERPEEERDSGGAKGSR